MAGWGRGIITDLMAGWGRGIITDLMAGEGHHYRPHGRVGEGHHYRPHGRVGEGHHYRPHGRVGKGHPPHTPTWQGGEGNITWQGGEGTTPTHTHMAGRERAPPPTHPHGHLITLAYLQYEVLDHPGKDGGTDEVDPPVRSDRSKES